MQCLPNQTFTISPMSQEKKDVVHGHTNEQARDEIPPCICKTSWVTDGRQLKNQISHPLKLKKRKYPPGKKANIKGTHPQQKLNIPTLIREKLPLAAYIFMGDYMRPPPSCLLRPSS